MEITIKINGRFMSVEVSAEVADYLEQAKRNNRKLYRERQRYWDGRECDEYIIATEGRLPYCATPEELVCQQETLDEILAVLALCTDTQRERFLLHALYDFNCLTPLNSTKRGSNLNPLPKKIFEILFSAFLGNKKAPALLVLK